MADKNNNTHDAQSDEQQPSSANEVGEHRNGRLSQIKNANPTDDGRENEYISEYERSRIDN